MSVTICPETYVILTKARRMTKNMIGYSMVQLMGPDVDFDGFEVIDNLSAHDIIYQANLKPSDRLNINQAKDLSKHINGLALKFNLKDHIEMLSGFSLALRYINKGLLKTLPIGQTVALDDRFERHLKQHDFFGKHVNV